MLLVVLKLLLEICLTLNYILVMELKGATEASKIDKELFLARVVSYLQSKTIFKAVDLSVWIEDYHLTCKGHSMRSNFLRN